MVNVVDIERRIRYIQEPWKPIEIAQVGNYVARVALFDGSYHWHVHEMEDELFFVYKGRILIRLKGQPDIQMHQGQMATIPAGVEHCPVSLEPSYVVMFEQKKLNSRGD
jgi:mannose-6-phosphate isomerase-like protein (cupin superfamily)